MPQCPLGAPKHAEPSTRTQALRQPRVHRVHSPHRLHQILPAELDLYRPLWLQDSSSAQPWEKRKERHFQVVGQGETQNGMVQCHLESMLKNEEEKGRRETKQRERTRKNLSYYSSHSMNAHQASQKRVCPTGSSAAGTSNALSSRFKAVTCKLFQKAGKLYKTTH